MKVKATVAERLAESIKRSGGNVRLNSPVLRLAYDESGRAVGIDLLSGDDDIAVDSALIGFKGVISVTANAAPRLMSELCKAALGGNVEAARVVQLGNQEDVGQAGAIAEGDAYDEQFAGLMEGARHG